MKSFLLLCTAVFQIALIFGDPIVCPETGQYFYEHKTSCSKFYECRDGVLAEVDCIDGLHFNPDLGYCDFPENVNCRICNDNVVRCPDEGQAFFPHSWDCSKFYECNDGILAQVDCIPGLHFNPELDFCDFPENVQCTPCTVAVECPDSGQHFYPHASDCTKFYECNYGDLAVVECIDGLHFNPGTNWCDFPENAGCEQGDGSSENASEGNENALECPESEKHVFPHPGYCTKFYECNYGTLAEVECVDGLHFNPILQWCDSPNNANCEIGSGGGDSEENETSEIPAEGGSEASMENSKENVTTESSIETTAENIGSNEGSSQGGQSGEPTTEDSNENGNSGETGGGSGEAGDSGETAGSGELEGSGETPASGETEGSVETGGSGETSGSGETVGPGETGASGETGGSGGMSGSGESVVTEETGASGETGGSGETSSSGEPTTEGSNENGNSGETGGGSGEAGDSGETAGSGELEGSGETPASGETEGSVETGDSGETNGSGETVGPGETGTSGETGGSGGISGSGETVVTEETGASGETGGSGETSSSGETVDPGDPGETGGSGETGDGSGEDSGSAEIEAPCVNGGPVGTCPAINSQYVVFLRHCSDCNSYFMCNWGTPILMNCASGLHFNSALNVCDWPFAAGCNVA